MRKRKTGTYRKAQSERPPGAIESPEGRSLLCLGRFHKLKSENALTGAFENTFLEAYHTHYFHLQTEQSFRKLPATPVRASHWASEHSDKHAPQADPDSDE